MSCEVPFFTVTSEVKKDGLPWHRFALIVAMAAAMLSPAWARPRDAGEPEMPANDLLRAAVTNEKTSSANDYFVWMDRLQKPRGSVTKLMLTTPQGILSRTVEINDRALNADERQQDDERINRLLDPEMMREKARKQQVDQQHIERLLMALPDAFRCDYSRSAHEDRNLHLECAPDPGFSPPNYESQVLQGMKAEILIDRDEKRISGITGTLFRDVTFGWGFLARLSRGGRIEIVQSRVAGKHWGLTRMQLDFEGRIVVVKPVHLAETESCWNYRSVPGMTVAEALEFLRNYSASPAQ
jgi:hypothetical protein